MATERKRKQTAELQAKSENVPTAGTGLTTAEADESAASNAVDQLGSSARTAFEEARGQSQQWMQGFEAAIRERPIRSVLMATGAGFIVALLWR